MPANRKFTNLINISFKFQYPLSSIILAVYDYNSINDAKILMRFLLSCSEMFKDSK